MDKNYVLVTMKTKEQKVQFIKKYSRLIVVKGAAHTWLGRARPTGNLRAEPPSPEQAAQERQKLQEMLMANGYHAPNSPEQPVLLQSYDDMLLQESLEEEEERVAW